MMFRGREMVRMDRGKVLLERFVEALKDICGGGAAAQGRGPEHVHDPGAKALTSMPDAR